MLRRDGGNGFTTNARRRTETNSELRTCRRMLFVRAIQRQLRSYGEGTIEFIFELLFQLILEVLAQILFELATALGWESLKDSMRSERESTPLLSGIGHFLMGLCAGVGSVLVFGSRVTPPSPIPGLSLVLSPLVTGVAMDRIGEYWRERGWDRPALFSFRAGAIFAFAMALVRFGALWRSVGIRSRPLAASGGRARQHRARPRPRSAPFAPIPVP